MPNKLTTVLFAFFLFFSRVPAQAEEPGRFRFIVMGCMHLAVFAPGDYDTLMGQIKKHKPDFILFSADTTEFPGEKPLEPSSWQEFKQAMDKANIPAYDLMNKCRLMTHASIPEERMVLNANRDSFVYKNNLFIYPGAAQEPNFFKKLSSDALSHSNTFFFTHQLPWFTGENDWADIIPSLAASKVKYIFGPNLQYLELKKSGESYILSKSLSCYLKRYRE
ncbi:MAG: hypothetical protein PHW54_05970, partial [Candidatus Omnitrophica bacterium]|nr:hypothetical protein [Candidatus Omnitrophota bacterium]